LAAASLACFCILAAILFHANWADPEQLINFNKTIAMAGGFLALVAFGGGAWSADHVLCARCRAGRR
jgi:putative oxidoreductase